jgi:hypothetical protein
MDTTPMEYTVQVFSNAFLDSEDNDFWSNATLSRDLWQELFREQTGQTRLFLSFPGSEHPVLCAVGNPYLSQTEEHSIYLPYEILGKLGLEGGGEQRQITVFSEEAFPHAERIKIRFLDSAAYNSDVKEELEHALTKLGVLCTHTQYQIPIQSLGNYPVDIFVEELEPADIVLCHGDEVAIEFEEPVDQITPPPPARPPTPIPADIPRLPDLMVPVFPPPEQSQGRLLGSDPNNAGPAWRQQIGPPRRR